MQTLTRLGGGLLNNHGTHYIDAIMDIMKSPITDVWSDMKLVSDAGASQIIRRVHGQHAAMSSGVRCLDTVQRRMRVR